MVCVLDDSGHHPLTLIFRVIDMARQFPHCDIVGIDLVPPRAEG